MAGKTTFLELVQPALNEFLNSWHEPINQNFEDIDDWVKDLYDSLVGSSSTSTWSSLRGSLGSLASRLDVSINDDGTIDLSGSTDILALASSTVYGTQGSPRVRFDLSDLEVSRARSPVYGDRFSTNPSALGDLEVGLAHITRDTGLGADNAMGSPSRGAHGWTAGSLDLSGSGVGKIVFSGTSIGAGNTWPVFAVDGHVFRIREPLVLDYSTLGGLADGTLVYLFVERRDYNNASYKYRGQSDATAATARDLRRLQGGADGVIGSSETLFTSASAMFSSATLGQVLPGDELVISSGAAAGTYIIASVGSNTQITINGKLKTKNLSGLSWYIWDSRCPNVGAVKVSSASDPPPYQAGRAYIGSCSHSTSDSPTSVISFAKNGLYDSGWSETITTATFPMVFDHHIGVRPTELHVWFRENEAGTEISGGQVKRTFVTGVSGDPSVAATTDFLLPSNQVIGSRVLAVVRLINQSPSAAIFCNSSETNLTSGQIRVIARR